MALMLTTGAAELRYDWSADSLSYLSDTSQFAVTQNLCASVLHAEPPVSDWPTSAERVGLKGCNSEALYYGIGMPADPVAARKCALLERWHDTGEGMGYFSGSGILAAVYANGRGAVRNLDVAIHMACGIEDAPAAADGRIEHLQALREGRQSGTFGMCDDATSGVSGGFCAQHEAALARDERKARVAKIGADWTTAQMRLFDRAYDLFGQYALTAHRMDCFRGTAQAMCAIAGQQADIARFIERVGVVAQGPLPTGETVGPSGAEGPAPNAATDGAWFSRMLANIPADDRPFYLENQKETIAARARFERALVAFMRAAYPRYSAHRVRVMFSDL